MTDKPPLGFVALRSVKTGPPDSTTALSQIREIYFKTTKRTIEHDIAHAITLLKSLPDEETREKATVYMHGLAEMRKEWIGREGGRGGKAKKAGGTEETQRARDKRKGRSKRRL